MSSPREPFSAFSFIDHAKDHAKGGSQALKKGQVITGKIGYEKAEKGLA
jgi:hypothetical protein